MWFIVGLICMKKIVMLVNDNYRAMSNNSYHSIVVYKPIVFIYHLLPYEGKGIIN